MIGAFKKRTQDAAILVPPHKQKARLPKQAGFVIHQRKFNLPP
jgi:hypothetical protein